MFSAAMSQNGSFFAYSVSGAVKVFQISFTLDNDEVLKPSLEKLQFENLIEFSSENQLVHLKFIKDDTLMLLSSSGRFITIAKINQTTNSVCFGDVQELQDTESSYLGVGLVATTASNLCITLDNRIIVYSFNQDFTISKCCSLPTHSALPSSITLHPLKPLVLVTYVDNSVLICNYNDGKIVCQEVVKKKVDDLQPFQGACWSSDGQTAVIFQNDSLFLLEITGDIIEPKRRKKLVSDEHNLRFQIKTCPSKYKYLAYVGGFGTDFVVVEVDPHSILEHLPPAFAKKRFGA